MNDPKEPDMTHDPELEPALSLPPAVRERVREPEKGAEG